MIASDIVFSVIRRTLLYFLHILKRKQRGLIDMEKSPFTVAEASETPWVLWEKHQPVIELIDKQTDGRYFFSEVHSFTSPSMPPKTEPTTSVERKQYMAVLNRMHQAAGRVGAFAQWDSVKT